MKSHKPALIFISEPQLFQCDCSLALAPLRGTYCHHLNSEDSFYPDLALESRSAKGGTLSLWHAALDPFVTLLPTPSPAVLPLLLSVPGLSPSAQVCIYLPTSGQEQEFVLAISALTAVLQSLAEEHPETPVYIRGDANMNPNNHRRVHLLDNLLSQFSLSRLNLGHPTHHHFQGEGASDSQLDVLLSSALPQKAESLDNIVCGQLNPLITSHHDLILSTFKCSLSPFFPPPQAVTAPRVEITRTRVCWEKEGQEQYEALLSSSLPILRESLCSPPSEALTSILLQCTNFALSRASEISFKTTQLSKVPRRKEIHVDRGVREAQKSALQASRLLQNLRSSQGSAVDILAAVQAKKNSSSVLRTAVRAANSYSARHRDSLLHTALSKDPSKLQAALKKVKSAGTPSMHLLQVGKNCYTGNALPDGFYEALLSLKVPDNTTRDQTANFKSASETYKHILQLAK